MKQLYDITPPPELVWEWTALANEQEDHEVWSFIATQAAQWGADQELEACCEWFICDWTDIETADKLRAARRPKPPSLKERALALISDDGLKPGEQLLSVHLELDSIEIIRRALEQLDD